MDSNKPSKQVRELIRLGAKLVIDTRQEWFEELREATLASDFMQAIARDPVAIEAVDRSHRSNLVHWATANVSRPGEPVPPNLSPEVLAIPRYLVRCGLDEAAVVDVYRSAQSASLRSWMRVAFRLTSDPDEMRELFEVSERSITSFLSATITGIHRQMRLERDKLTRKTHSERREIVELILDGAPISRQRIVQGLGYRLEQTHAAAVVWGDQARTGLSDLDRVAEALMHGTGGLRSLSVLAGAATRWVWLPGDDGPNLADAEDAIDRLPSDVRIAIGSTAAGIEGFRRSHLDAITTQRMMARLGSAQRIVRFADIQLVDLMTADPGQTDRFVTQTLGEFESAAPELQRTIRTFIDEQCNASRAARLLFTHRSTLLRRLARADELLPKPLEDNSVHVAVALEVLRWRGTPR